MTLTDIAAIIWIVAGVLMSITTVETRKSLDKAINKLMEEVNDGQH